MTNKEQSKDSATRSVVSSVRVPTSDPEVGSFNGYISGKAVDALPPRERVMTDIAKPEHVEVLVSEDAKTLWVNVEGQCLLRVTRIKELDMNIDNKG